MARGILSEYGPDAHKPQAPRATCGGVERARDVMNYKPPQGPTTFSHKGPGLANHTNYPCGSQGPHGVRDGGGGSPGIGGDVDRDGSQGPD